MQNKQIQSNDFLFNDFQKEVDKAFTDLIHNLPNEFFNYVKTKILETETFFKNSSFQLELVVDTNIIFSEVRSLMVNGSSFFLKIADNPFIKIYAPSQLRQELYEKIKLKFPKDSKTKNFDIKDCLAKADLLLSKITIRDDITTASWNKAKSYLQERDAKDISFVALHFTLKTHGVLTKDKDINDQEEIKTWKLGEAGKVITEINKGTFSFLILNVSLPPIWEAIYGLVATIWAAFIEIVEGLITLFAAVLTRSVNAIANMPPELALIIGITAVFIMVADELREKVGEFFKMLWEQIKKFIRAIREIFKAIWETLKEIFEALKPVFNVSLQLLAYFVLQSVQAMQRLDQLEKVRPE
jgi:predicted nucleic acid-binding protein